ncbi:MAG: glucosamine-6-phosphate deaminase [Treponema sp.]|nr:glucosamine-6-phosphate deaminase [Treponema sp.]
MRLIIKDNYDDCAEWTAKYIAKKIKDANPTEDKPYVLGLPTGSTPLGVYKKLIELNKAGDISFKNVITFNMDEYVGLKDDDVQSYHYFMYTNFFNHIDIRKENIHILNGCAEDLEEECRKYEEEIVKAGGIDLFLGGAGNDGHIAFNEPGSSLTSRTRQKTLTDDTLKANSRFFDNDITKVPKTSLTVGIGTIMDARKVIIMMSGAAKSRALQQVIEGSVSSMWPVTALQLHRKAIIVADEDCTGDLKVSTAKYFKSIESKVKDF